jgi:FkbH-like protein
VSFQVEFSHSASEPSQSTATTRSTLDARAIESAWFLRWEEHCVECAAPACFQSCALYAPRADGMCARFYNGIAPNPRYPGMLEYGGELRFKRWGKLEANLQRAFCAPLDSIRAMDTRDRRLMRSVGSVAPAWNTALPIRKTNAYILANKWRNRALERAAREQRSTTAPHEFYAEIVNLEAEPLTLTLELVVGGHVRFRDALQLVPGENAHRIPFNRFDIATEELFGRPALLRLHPEADAEASIVVRWLTFVRHAAMPQVAESAMNLSQRTATPSAPAARVKAVVWDLDNTVWNGVLGELEASQVVVRENVRQTIAELDARGILQSVASKNDFEHAWGTLQRLGLSDFFLYPQVHWSPKSTSLESIAAELNIGIDSLALIDDSSFERDEVRSALPCVRVYDVVALPDLLQQIEFDVPRTREAQNRRELYRVEERRKSAAVAHTGDYRKFLQSCNLFAQLAVPRNQADLERCHELIQRTNQLNASGNRYTWPEFLARIADTTRWHLTISCRDRFGDYGLVGFVSVAMHAEEALVEDFVLSCRVAQKRVEHAVFAYLRNEAIRRGCRRFAMRFVPSARNGIMRESLLSVGFQWDAAADVAQTVQLPIDAVIPESDIVAIQVDPEPAEPALRHVANAQS